MAVTHQIIDLSDTDPIAVSATGNHTGRDITIQNISDTAYVYLGGQGVSVGNYGYRIPPLAGWSVELRGGEIIYAVTSENGSQAAVMQLGLEETSHNG